MTTEIVNLLKKLESFKSEPYFDYKGYSIGYGHFIGKKSDWTGGSISEAQAHSLLLEDIAKMEAYVKPYFTQTLSGRKLDAITLFAFQFGPANLKSATFVKMLNEGSTNTAEIETWWRKWNKAGGKYIKSIEQRRIMETDIWYDRLIRIPDYIGGGTLNLSAEASTNNASPGADIEPLYIPKKLPLIPILLGVGLIGGTGGYLYYKNRPKKALSGFLPSIPFWAKIAIAGGAMLIAGTAYSYAKPNTHSILPEITPTSIMTTASLSTDQKLLIIESNDLTIDNQVSNLPKHKTKKYMTRGLSVLTHIVLHHTAGNPAETIESIAKYHINSTADKYPAIAYHFVIYPDGRVFQTNYLTTKSWHVANFNTGCIGISLTGNFDIKNNVPTDAQMASGQKLVLALQSAMQGAIGRKLLVKGHKEVAQKGHATACPGRYFPLATFHNL